MPVEDALPVPGLRTVSWSVPALSRQGHQVTFGFSTVTIRPLVNTNNEVTVRIRHPMNVHNDAQHQPFALTGAANATASSGRTPAHSSMATASAPGSDEAPNQSDADESIVALDQDDDGSTIELPPDDESVSSGGSEQRTALSPGEFGVVWNHFGPSPEPETAPNPAVPSDDDETSHNSQEA